MPARKPSFVAIGPAVGAAAAAVLAVAAAFAFRRYGARPRAQRTGLRGLNVLELSAARMRSLDADEFFELCKAYYHSRHFRLRTASTRGNARDAVLYFGTLPYAVAVVRFIEPTAKAVDEADIRDLADVMSLHGVGKGIVHAPRAYTADAIAFARVNRIRLVSGEDLLRNISGMPASARSAMSELLRPITADDTAMH